MKADMQLKRLLLSNAIDSPTTLLLEGGKMDRVKAENFLAKWHWWIIWLDLIKSKAKRAVKDAAS